MAQLKSGSTVGGATIVHADNISDYAGGGGSLIGTVSFAGGTTSGTFTIPDGVEYIGMMVIGGGGGGLGYGYSNNARTAGGGGEVYQIVKTEGLGNTLTYTVGARGNAGWSSGGSGGASTVVSGNGVTIATGNGGPGANYPAGSKPRGTGVGLPVSENVPYAYTNSVANGNLPDVSKTKAVIRSGLGGYDFFDTGRGSNSVGQPGQVGGVLFWW